MCKKPHWWLQTVEKGTMYGPGLLCGLLEDTSLDPYNETVLKNNKSLTAVVRLLKSLYEDYLIISNIVAISSVAIDTFDFSIKIFPPVIMYEGITLIPL